MKYSDYAKWTARATQWIETYFDTLRDKPVRAQTQIGEIAARLPSAPPESATDMETIISDFDRIVPDGLTHWQHPGFFAYFQSNAAPASMIAEQLTNASRLRNSLFAIMGPQVISPAATALALFTWLSSFFCVILGSTRSENNIYRKIRTTHGKTLEKRDQNVFNTC